MKKQLVITVLILIIFSFFSVHTVFVYAQDANGIEVNLGVDTTPLCNHNLLCESNIGETPSNCPSDCFPPPGSGGRGVLLPLSKEDTIPPQNPRNVQAIVKTDGIALSWLNPPDLDFSYIRIMRNEDHFYGDPFSGTLIYEGAKEYFFDKNVTPGTKYFYTLFSRDITGNFSSGSAVSAVAFSFTKIPPPPISIPSVEDVAISSSAKYLVHQYNQKVQLLSDITPVIVNDRYTIIIDTETLIPTGDYLVVTGPGLENPGQYMFSFNKDSGRFQSVIPPLTESGTYNVKIYRYEEKILKLIGEGSLIVNKDKTFKVEESYPTSYFYFFYIIIIFIIIFLMFFILKHRRKNQYK